jgi:hypothetical protein
MVIITQEPKLREKIGIGTVRIAQGKMLIVGDVELLAMLMNSPNNQFHDLCLTLRGASGSRLPAMLGNMDRIGLRDIAGGKNSGVCRHGVRPVSECERNDERKPRTIAYLSFFLQGRFP